MQRIPFEIQLQIIQAATEDEIWCDAREDNVRGLVARNGTLARCRAVCSAWDDFAKSKLFAHPVLLDFDAVESFLRLIDDRTTRRSICPLVRCITTTPEDCSDFLLPDLSCFPNLKSLDGFDWPFDAAHRPLRGVQLEHLGLFLLDDDLSWSSEVIPQLSDISSLSLSGGGAGLTSTIDSNILVYLSCLRHLRISLSDPEDLEDVEDALIQGLEIVGRQLETFQLTVESSASATAAYMVSPALVALVPHVHSLSLYGDHGFTDPCVFLPNLRRLYFGHHPNWVPGDDGFLQWPPGRDTSNLTHRLLMVPFLPKTGRRQPAHPEVPALREVGLQALDFSFAFSRTSLAILQAAKVLKSKNMRLLDRHGRAHPCV